MEKWVEVRTAYQVAKTGTVTAAAEALGIHRATVNRHIDLLEAEIQTKLFLRNKRGYVLTEAGEDFLRISHKASEMFTDFAARARFGNTETTNDMILTAHTALRSILMPSIIAFRKEYPKTHVTIQAQDSLAKLEYGEAHVAIASRIEPDQPDYVVQSFGSLRFGLYAHDKYISRKGHPDLPDDFQHHDFIANPEFAERVPIEAWVLRNIPKDRRVMQSSHPSITQEAILAGVAIGILPEFMAKLHGDLHEIVKPKTNWNIPIWLVTHVDLHRSIKIQKMLQCIKDTLKGETIP
ncbi:MAG: LysR family transcriptional regulator [Pseudomonadota bacterium]